LPDERIFGFGKIGGSQPPRVTLLAAGREVVRWRQP
jgi:hypothetical protein